MLRPYYGALVQCLTRTVVWETGQEGQHLPVTVLTLALLGLQAIARRTLPRLLMLKKPDSNSGTPNGEHRGDISLCLYHFRQVHWVIVAILQYWTTG